MVLKLILVRIVRSIVSLVIESLLDHSQISSLTLKMSNPQSEGVWWRSHIN